MSNTDRLREAHEQLDALYATLPTVECKRLCGAYCGPILIPKIEAQRLEAKRGYLEYDASFVPATGQHVPAPEYVLKNYVAVKGDEDHRCRFLIPWPKPNCMAYAIRPLICRCWGCVDHEFLRCPHGCKPTRWISQQEFRELNLKVCEMQSSLEDRC